MTRPRTFPTLPWSWYYACRQADLARGPCGVSIGHRQFVVFQATGGRISVLDRRCVHMGADLALGCVSGDNIRCPFHEWEFGGDGRCVRIPAGSEIPAFARQTAYPVRVHGGHVFFFNRPQATFDAPFFEGTEPAHLLPARPFDLNVDMPWYMVGANGFDLQHFRAAHDRTLIGEPVIEQPSPFARRIRGNFAVTGRGVRDRMTRCFSGSEVTMTVTSWCGTIVLTTAAFRRTTSYGMLCVAPIDALRSRLRVIPWVPRSRSAIGRTLFDPVDAAIRRSFIRAFVRSDEERSRGIGYTPGTLIDADAALSGYLHWLLETVQGERC